MTILTKRISTPRLVLATAIATGLGLMLAACSPGLSLSPGLTQQMNKPGAELNRVEALFLLNDYRRQQGAPAVRGDSVLDGIAQTLASNYAKTGAQPTLPAGATVMRLSAGYTTFAEVFSGWRNAPPDAAAISDPTTSRAGIGVAYEPGSSLGTYWVLVLAQ